MATTTYTDNVEILGSRDINQLKVKGYSTQTTLLTDWQDSTGASKASVDNSGKITASALTMATGATNGYILTSDSCGNGMWKPAAGSIGSSSSICEGRLTLLSGTPVPDADQYRTTFYFTPYVGNRVTLFTGSWWTTYAFSELSLAVPSSANTNYDIFLYDNNGTLTLSPVAWTNDTTRAVALVLQDGVYGKSGATTNRYLGTIRTCGTSGYCEDSARLRYIWNYSNRLQRRLYFTDNTATWTYNSTTWRTSNNNSNNCTAFVGGLNEDPVMLRIDTDCVAAANSALQGAVGLDSTTTPTGTYSWGGVRGVYNGQPSLGFHWLASLERVSWGTDGTFYGAPYFGANGYTWA